MMKAYSGKLAGKYCNLDLMALNKKFTLTTTAILTRKVRRRYIATVTAHRWYVRRVSGKPDSLTTGHQVYTVLQTLYNLTSEPEKESYGKPCTPAIRIDISAWCTKPLLSVKYRVSLRGRGTMLAIALFVDKLFCRILASMGCFSIWV